MRESSRSGRHGAKDVKMSSSQSDSRVRLVDCEKLPSSLSSLSSSSSPSSSSSSKSSSMCDARTDRGRVSVVVAWTVCGLACLLTAWTAVLYWTQLSQLRADLDSLRRDFENANQLTAHHIDSAVQQVIGLPLHVYHHHHNHFVLSNSNMSMKWTFQQHNKQPRLISIYDSL